MWKNGGNGGGGEMHTGFIIMEVDGALVRSLSVVESHSTNIAFMQSAFGTLSPPFDWASSVWTELDEQLHAVLGLHESQLSLASAKSLHVSTRGELFGTTSTDPVDDSWCCSATAVRIRPRRLSEHELNWAWSCQRFSLPTSDIVRNEFRGRRTRFWWSPAAALATGANFFLSWRLPVVFLHFRIKRFTPVWLLILHLIAGNCCCCCCFALPFFRCVFPGLAVLVAAHTLPVLKRRFGVMAVVVCFRFFSAGVFLIILRRFIEGLLFGCAIRLLRFSLRSHIFEQLQSCLSMAEKLIERESEKDELFFRCRAKWNYLYN